MNDDKDTIKVGDIIKIKVESVKNGFAGEGYTEEDRFEVISIDERYNPGPRLVTRLIGYGGECYDFFAAYMVERA